MPRGVHDRRGHREDPVVGILNRPCLNRGPVGGGLESKQAVFAIRLGEKPAQESLTKGMLGG